MRTIKNPNVKGPRFRGHRMSILTNETLKALKKKYPEYAYLSLTDFRDIIMTFNKNIVEGILENRNGIELPEGLGFIFMGSCPPAKKKNIDYHKSQELGIEVIHRNWDSDNNLLKIFYTNYMSKYPFANKEVWVFKAVKQFRKKASASFKENWPRYIQVDPTKKIASLFDRRRRKTYMQTLKPNIPQDYNEFKI